MAETNLTQQEQATEEVAVEQPTLTSERREELLEELNATLKSEQRLSLAIVGGVAALIVSAILWALITVATKYQIGYMAIAVGFIVGFAVRFFGKGVTPIYGVIGAVCAFLGCLFGNILSGAGFLAPEWGVSYFEALRVVLTPDVLVLYLKESFQGIDLLFYGIAIYEGYRFSFRIVDESLLTN